MAQIFRVERTKNFTVMSNHHFKNKNLTLKAKGLLSLMLSLPDNWNYNMQGLATLSRDGIDSVRSAIRELEHHGYVERHRLRNEYSFYGDTEYIIREVPFGEEKCLRVDSPILDNQVIGNSYLRTSENRKPRYGKFHIGQTVAINNICYQIRIIK